MLDNIKKWIACILAVLQLLICGVILGDLNPPQRPAEPQENLVNDIAGDSNLSASVLAAAKASNAVQAVYTDSTRSRYQMRNAQMVLTHNLSITGNAGATLNAAGGGSYLTDTLDPYYVTTGGQKYYASASADKARPNTIRLGEYYYESHIRDLKFEKKAGGAFWVDKTYHIYADRLYQEIILLANAASTALGAFGQDTKIAVDQVAALQIRDANGIHSTLDGVDAATVEYVAFDIKEVGIVGFIIPSDGSTAFTRVTSDGKNYTITQQANFTGGTGVNKFDESGGYALNSVRFGSRIYTDAAHDFAGIEAAAVLERNPLQGISVTGGNANGEYLGYEPLRGSYKFTMDGTDFGTAYVNPDRHYTAPIRIQGDASDRDIYIRMNGKIGCLEAATLLDSSGKMAAMNVQVGKNFQGDGGEPIYSVKDYMYGDSTFPLVIKANETLDFTLVNLFQNWGKFPLKQISSIEFHVSYYHLSTGATESNCIAPYFVFGKDGWTLPDFRGASGDIWEGQPQFNSTGCLYFAEYTKGLFNTKVGSEYTGSLIRSSGLAYADMDYNYTSDCGSYDYSLRHVEMPQTDENRTYYELDLTFNRDITFQNFRRDFSLFSYNSRDLAYNKAEYLDENNQPQTRDLPQSILSTCKEIVLGKEAPYFGYYDIKEKDVERHQTTNFGANFGLIVKDSDITIGGEKWDGNFVFRDSYDGKKNTASLTLNEKTVSFKAGDSIQVQFILLPWGKLSEKQNGTVQAVREDSVLKGAKTTAAVGTVIADAYVPMVQSASNAAEFTVQGGKGNMAVRVNGFTENTCPTIESWNGSAWEPVNLASVNGYDGYTIYYDKLTGLYDFSFVYKAADADTAYTFRMAQ